MAQPNWDLPLPNYEKDVNKLSKTYRNAIQEVILKIEQLSTYGKEKDISREQMNSTLAQLSVLLKKLDGEAESFIQSEIEEAFKNGQAEAVIAAGKAETLEEAVKMATMSEMARTQIEVMVNDTFDDLLEANKQMKRQTVKMVRQVVSEQMKTKAAQGQGRNTTRKGIVEALSKKELRERWQEEGNIAITDKSGRKWKLGTYAEMVTRTKMLQAHAEGTRIESIERGIDLAIVSSHGAKDECSKFEGMVISMNGDTEGFMTYDELRSSNLIFHPNCRHKISPIRSLDMLPDDVRKEFLRKNKEAQAALKKQKSKK